MYSTKALVQYTTFVQNTIMFKKIDFSPIMNHNVIDYFGANIYIMGYGYRSKKAVFIHGNTLYTNHSFNEPFDDKHYKMMSRVKHIVLGNEFNRIFNIPPHILSIRFPNGYSHYKQIVLTPNLISLFFNYCRDVCLIDLGPCVKYLTIGSSHYHSYYSREYRVILNKYLIHLKIHGSADLNFVSSKYLKELIFTHQLGQIILNSHMKKIVLSDDFNQSIDLTKKVEILKTGDRFTSILVLNKNMCTIKLGCDFNHIISLPKHLKNIYFPLKYKHSIILPPHMKNLYVDFFTCENFLIEHSNVKMHLFISGYLYGFINYYPNLIDSLPDGFSCVKTYQPVEVMKLFNNLPITTRIVKRETDFN